MMAKPMKTLHLHYPMIQFLIIDVSIISIGEYKNRAFWLAEKLGLWRYIHRQARWI